MKKTVLTIISASLLLTSCNMDFFPIGRLDQENAIESVEDAAKAANYFNIRLRSLYSGSNVYVSELASDIFHASAGYGNRGGDIYRWEMLSESGTAEGVWSSAYTSVANANYLIKMIDKLDKSEYSETEKAALENYLGQAAFLKAAVMYALVERYCPVYNASTANTDMGVMLVHEFAPTSDASKYPGRSSLADTYKYIEENLAIAEQKINNPNKLASELITPDAVKAFKARVALSKKDYATAAKCAKELVDGGKYALLDATAETAAEDWKNLWTNDSGAECIVQFYANYAEQSTGSTVTYSYYGLNSAGVFAPDFIPETHVLDMYSDTDIRSTWFEKHNVTVNSLTGEAVLFNKFPGNPDLQSPTAATSSYIHKIKPFRIAEQYLIAAEALAMSGDEASAREYLNALYLKRNPQGAEVKSSGNALIQAIRTERFRELIGEGFRWYDLKRYGEGFSRSSLQNPLISTERGSDLTIAADHRGWCWPIPQSEIDANPQIKDQQNPGYTK